MLVRYRLLYATNMMSIDLTRSKMETKNARSFKLEYFQKYSHFSAKNLVKISFREQRVLSSSPFVQACFFVPRNTAFIGERKTEHARYCIAGAPGISSSLHRATYFVESRLSSCDHLHCNEIERLRSVIM